MSDLCGDPNCFQCMWLTEAVIRFNDGIKAAVLAAAADLPPITYRRWLPGDEPTTTNPEA
jgi:hypothetical protein